MAAAPGSKLQDESLQFLCIGIKLQGSAKMTNGWKGWGSRMGLQARNSSCPSGEVGPRGGADQGPEIPKTQPSQMPLRAGNTPAIHLPVTRQGITFNPCFLQWGEGSPKAEAEV